MRRAVPLLLALVGLLTAPLCLAGGDAPAIPDAWVAEALDAAGTNRVSFEEVLAHYAPGGAGADAHKLAAARFLVANMLGHGYVQTELRDAAGSAVPYDPLAYPTFKESRQALEVLDGEHGPLDFARDRLVHDLETMSADYLRQHIDQAMEAWRSAPSEARVSFPAFLEHVLPYRGSQEPLDAWIAPLRTRYAGWWGEAEGDPQALWKRLSKDVHQRVRFNERFYLHPTDQGFSEMLATGQGRCEDITNMITYASRSVALATAADYTPAWAHRDNNHAWNVLLDREGRGSVASNAHAAKVYRKTFSLQRDSLPFLLREGEELPNRWMSSKTFVDVTDQYRTTSHVDAPLDPAVCRGHRVAYACVFNGGRWVAIDWGWIKGGRARFRRLGRGVIWLPAVYGGGELHPAGCPFVLHTNGTVRRLPGSGGTTELLATATRPRQKSPDTHIETPTSHLAAGSTYHLHLWTLDGWTELEQAQATAAPLRLQALPADGLYWMVEADSRRLERIFTIEGGVQRWW